ncbi:histidinol dehydrogenase, partial [Micrococcus sp. SIMBA_131]
RNEGISIKRSIEQGTEDQRHAVLSILSQVKETGDQAVKENTKKFDGADLTELRVSTEEIEKAYRDLSDELITTIRQAAMNIQPFHERQ